MVKLGLIFVNSFSIIVDNFEYLFPQLVKGQTVKPLSGQFYTFITKTAGYKSVEMFMNSLCHYKLQIQNLCPSLIVFIKP